MRTAAECILSQIERPGIRTILPSEANYCSVIDYIGAYTYWDIPFTELPQGSQLTPATHVATRPT
jgi:hypothetical protein